MIATGSAGVSVVCVVLVRVSAALSSLVPLPVSLAVWLLLDVPCDEDESEKSSEARGGV